VHRASMAPTVHGTRARGCPHGCRLAEAAAAAWPAPLHAAVPPLTWALQRPRPLWAGGRRERGSALLRAVSEPGGFEGGTPRPRGMPPRRSEQREAGRRSGTRGSEASGRPLEPSLSGEEEASAQGERTVQAELGAGEEADPHDSLVADWSDRGWEAPLLEFWLKMGVPEPRARRFVELGASRSLWRDKERLQSRLKSVKELFPRANAVAMAQADPALLSLPPEALASNYEGMKRLLPELPVYDMATSSPGLLVRKPEALKENFDRLKEMLPGANVSKLVARQQHMLMEPAGVEKKLEDLQQALEGMPVLRLVQKFNEVLTMDEQVLVSRVDFLKEQLGARNCARALRTFPTLIQQSRENIVYRRQVIEQLLPRVNFQSMIGKQPSLLCRDPARLAQNFAELDTVFAGEDTEELVRRMPSILEYDPETVIKKLDALEKTLPFLDTRTLVLKNPSLICYNPITVGQKVQLMNEGLALSPQWDEEQTRWTPATYASVLTCSRKRIMRLFHVAALPEGERGAYAATTVLNASAAKFRELYPSISEQEDLKWESEGRWDGKSVVVVRGSELRGAAAQRTGVPGKTTVTRRRKAKNVS